MKRVKTFKVLFSSLLIGLMAFSCDVGLGEAVDITGPEISILTPSVSQSVSKQFTISGLATDDYGLSTIKVDINGETDDFSESYRWINGSWMHLESGNWVDCSMITSSGDNKTVRFEIPVNAQNASSGNEYTITSEVSDAYSNNGGKTKDERNVIIDIVEPVVSIIEPQRLFSADDREFDKYVLQNNSVLPKIKNGTFEISGSQKEDTNLDYLVVYLDKEESPIPDGTTVYPVANPIVKKTITGTNLRNWSTTITPDDFTDKTVLAFDKTASDKDKGHILRLVTESHDQAGNIELKSQGWFKFNNGADIPWVSATFGFDNAAVSKNTDNRVYPRCSLQGQAYDDDGLREISIKIYEADGVTEIADYSVKESQLASEGYPTYKAWSLNALSETKTICVKINCTDKNGIKGDEVIRWMTISDVNPPNISEISPANGTSVLINANGSFSFTGKVDDDGSIDFVKIVRIKSGNENDQMDYFDKDYKEWGKCTTVNAPHVDSKGNKVWMLALSDETTVENRKVRTWNKTFNIFTDFGIDGTEKLINQKFIILAQDVGKSANLEVFTLQGDIDPPEITIDTIYLNDMTQGNTFELKEEPIELPKPFTRDDSQKITDKIKLSGTWKDNSTTLWTDKTKHGEFYLTVATKQVPVTLSYDNTNNIGIWTTEFFEPVDSSVAVIDASFEDWGGNKTKASRSYYVNSSTPVLSRIGAETSDGSYKAGSEIIITMEFNKAITFEGGNPVLKLNAGGGTRKAEYFGGNGNSKHKFKYTVNPGDDVDVLNVTGIIDDGISWKQADTNTTTNVVEIEKKNGHLEIPVTGGSSLAGGRSIVIDTKPPVLQSISAISGSGWNNAGKSIFIQAKFSEDITITPKDLKDLKLKFNNGAETESASKTGADTVLFKYLVDNNDTDTSMLQVSGVLSSGYTISDPAGNTLTSITELPNNLPSTGEEVIKIDTKAPVVPEIKDLPSQTAIYADSFSFTIEGFEEGAAEKKYTLDGSTWLDYKIGDVIRVTANGDYNIAAYQTDAAGNRSTGEVYQSRTLNTNKIITSITAEQSDGIYTTGNEIIIKLNCSENLILDETKTSGKANSYLILNTTPEQKAYYLSGSGTKEIKFKYTIAEGDTCDTASGLDVLEFNSKVKTDSKGIDFTNRCGLPENNNLSDNRTINVITGEPVIQSVTVDQSKTDPVIKIIFSNPVSKNVGKYIKVSQTYNKPVSGTTTVVYNAPAVLTKAQYNNFKAVTNAVDTYYEKGVNGLKADNVTPDLSEKYILKFNYDGTTKAVREFFRDTVIDSTNNGTILDVYIPIASSKVSVDKSNDRILLVTLSDAYKLPVKGAEYTITVPDSIAVDSQGHGNPKQGGKDYSYQQTFTLNGCENPSIRIDKSECTISGGVATQPLQAQVKIDCQTPGKTIKYSISTVETETKTINGTSLPKSQTTPVSPNNPKNPVTTTGTYSTETPLMIGSSSNKSSGYKITIDAQLDGQNVHAYEIAYRSVVRLQAGTPSAAGDNGGFSEASNMNKVYIRGGDSESGNSTTVGFPLSWNSGDYGKTKMMTKDGDYWYYVSWNISVNLYYGFLRGNTGSSDADTMANGPLNWCWASCSWVGRKQLYYLQPGTSFTMVPTDSYNTGGYQYQLKHAEYRTQATQKNGYGVLVESIN